jgi:hypothetical protein
MIDLSMIDDDLNLRKAINRETGKFGYPNAIGSYLVNLIHNKKHYKI